jgi:hypothetical protein
LLESLEARARAAGVNVLRLDTNRHLAEARSLYLRNGYDEIPPYNRNPYAHYWFEKRVAPAGASAPTCHARRTRRGGLDINPGCVSAPIRAKAARTVRE